MMNAYCSALCGWNIDVSYLLLCCQVVVIGDECPILKFVLSWTRSGESCNWMESNGMADKPVAQCGGSKDFRFSSLLSPRNQTPCLHWKISSPSSSSCSPQPAPTNRKSCSSSSGVKLSDISSTTAQHMAHRAADAVMGPRTIEHETVVSDACNMHSRLRQRYL